MEQIELVKNVSAFEIMRLHTLFIEKYNILKQVDRKMLRDYLKLLSNPVITLNEEKENEG